MVDGFLGRWSQRKIALKEGKPVEDVPPPSQAPKTSTASAPPTSANSAALVAPDTPAPIGIWGQPNFQAYGAPAQPHAASGVRDEPVAEPTAEPAQAQAATPPTLEDAQTLTPQSDFKPYMSAQVNPEVRNAAMKKLFADPHFNVMDGLDIYIDDYTKPDPLPMSMMRQMASANFLGLFDDEKKQEAALAAAEKSVHASEPEPQLNQPEAPEQLPAKFESQLPANCESQVSANHAASQHSAPTSPTPGSDTPPDAST